MWIPKEAHYEMLKPFEAPSAREVREYVMESSANVDFPKKIILPLTVTTLGNKLGQFYDSLRSTLPTKITGDFDEAVANTHKILRQACHFPLFSEWSTDDKQEHSDFGIWTLENESDLGEASRLYTYLDDMEEDETVLEDVGLDDKNIWEICILHWLSLADSCCIQEKKYDLIAEVFQAIMIQSHFLGWDSAEEIRSNMMREAAQKRLLNDPKQEALTAISKHYEEKKSKFKLRGFTAQFVREMHAIYPVITSIKTIENLVAKLNANNELIPR
jgi:hypothetical protein